jgi:hypothetical protein
VVFFLNGCAIIRSAYSGSIEKDILKQEGGATVQALIKSALRHIQLCRDFGAQSLVLSVKSSDVVKTIEAYRSVSQETSVPLHLSRSRYRWPVPSFLNKCSCRLIEFVDFQTQSIFLRLFK